MVKRWSLVVVICSLFLLTFNIYAESDPKCLMIRPLRELFFGYLDRGSATVTIDPKKPYAGAYPAAIRLYGSPWSEYHVILPDHINIKRGHSKIPVYDFTTNLANNQGRLNSRGRSTFLIGATIGPIPINARQGNYKGRAVVTVYYAH